MGYPCTRRGPYALLTGARAYVALREIRWIRNWLSRYRKGRTKSSSDVPNATRKPGPKTRSAPASTASSTVTAADSSGSDPSQTALGGTISIHRLLQIHQDTGRREKRKRKPDAAVTSSDSSAEPTSAPAVPYVQIARPGTSFCLPLHASPQSQPSDSSSGSLQVDNSVKTRSLTQSPSLGYIPLAFPMQLSQPPAANVSDYTVLDALSGQPTDAGNTYSSVAPDPQYSIGAEASQPMMYSQCFVPVAPTLPLEFTQAELADGQPSANMLYLSQLLLDASNVHVPPPATGDPGDSDYLSGLSPLSFAPSLQSHSTSVLGTASMNLPRQNIWYPPPPVAFRARVTDLALLTKRIRTTYEQNADVPGVKGLSSVCIPAVRVPLTC